MSRPRKWRSVCSLPPNSRFGPLGPSLEGLQPVVMTVDEYETIRLIDHEGMTQQECSEEMEVARTTVQGMYDSARKKLAASLVDGKPLCIEGGEYHLHDHNGPGFGRGGRGCRWRQRMGNEEGESQL